MIQMKDSSPDEKRSIKYDDKALSGFSKISLEPIVFLTIFSSMMYQLIVQNLYLEKACRVDLGFNASICDAMTNRQAVGYKKSQEEEVQKLVTKMIALRSFIQGCFPVLILMFAGSWSDKHNRRKPLILFPILGELLCCIGLIINAIFFYEFPIIISTLVDSLPLSLMGGWPCLLTGVYSYIGNRIDEHNRTLKVGLIAASSMTASIVGSSCAGIIFSSVGFVTSFSICISLLAVAITLGYFFIEDEKMDFKKNKSLFGELFDIKQVLRVLEIFRNSKSRKNRIITILFAGVVTVCPWNAEISLNYMYTRMKFLWSAVDYSVFSGYQLFVQVTGVIISIFIFSKFLKFQDATLGIIGHIGSMVASVIYGTAPKDKYFYLGVYFDTFHMSAQVAVRSLLSKSVPSNKLGQANSLLALVDTGFTMLFGPLFSAIYKYTIDIYPGIYFFTSAFTRLMGFCTFTWLYWRTSRDKKAYDVRKKNEMNLYSNTNIEEEQKTETLLG